MSWSFKNIGGKNIPSIATGVGSGIAAGSFAGPPGMIIGGLAGAVSGIFRAGNAATTTTKYRSDISNDSMLAGIDRGTEGAFWKTSSWEETKPPNNMFSDVLDSSIQIAGMIGGLKKPGITKDIASGPIINEKSIMTADHLKVNRFIPSVGGGYDGIYKMPSMLDTKIEELQQLIHMTPDSTRIMQGLFGPGTLIRPGSIKAISQ